MPGYRNSAFLWLAALFVSSLLAQSDKLFRLRGEVAGGARDLSGLTVELVDVSRHLPIDHMLLTQNGVFEFSHLAAGWYQIRVVSQDGTILRQEQHDVNQMGGDIVIELPKRPESQPAADSISVARLNHKIPPKAKKAFAAAQKRQAAGDVAGSVEKLQEAIELDPQYLEAHNNLGCRMLSLGRSEEAIASFHRPIEIDPHAPFAHANLAVALLIQQRPAEAETAARKAIETDGGISKTRYVLGMALFNQHKFTREAAQSLRQSEDEFPNARLAAAAVFERLGEVKEAKVELNSYLSNAAAPKQPEVRAWLSRLK